MKIPKDCYQLHKFVIWAVDVIFVNGISFFVTLSQNIILITCIYVASCTSGQSSKYLMNIVKLYYRSGFLTCLVLMDMVFEKIKDKVGLLEVNTTACKKLNNVFSP